MERMRKKQIMNKHNGKHELFFYKSLSSSSKSDDVKPCIQNCKCYINGNCRFGFLTKYKGTPKVKFSFMHPKLCKKLMEHGTMKGGCHLGSKCSHSMLKCVQNLLQAGHAKCLRIEETL